MAAASDHPVPSAGEEETGLRPFQAAYISTALSANALTFGTFNLKSGRVSPYFFNAGAFCTGSLLDAMASCYADRIAESGVQFDVLFGPAYKGIPLAATTASALSRQHGIDVGYAFNRKEAKDHGEGGSLVGANIKGKRVLVIDDVITAGTAMREAVEIIRAQDGATLAGAVVALDRQERGKGQRSTIAEVEEEYGTRVYSVIRLEDIIGYIRTKPGMEKEIAAMNEYRATYGV